MMVFWFVSSNIYLVPPHAIYHAKSQKLPRHIADSYKAYSSCYELKYEYQTI